MAAIVRAAVGRAAARRTRARPRGGRDHAPAARVGGRRSARPSRYLRYPPVGPARRRAADPRRGHGRARPRATSPASSTSGSSASSRSSRRRAVDDADEIAALDERRRPVRRPGRPVAQPGRPRPVRRPGLPRRAPHGRRGLRAPRQGGRDPRLRRRGPVAAITSSASAFIGLGSEGAFVSAGATGDAGGRRARLRLAGARPPPRAASPAPAHPSAGVRSGR